MQYDVRLIDRKTGKELTYYGRYYYRQKAEKIARQESRNNGMNTFAVITTDVSGESRHRYFHLGRLYKPHS